MASCEACNVKFNLFKRKRRCMDCLRYFCSDCVIKRIDKMLSCDSCSILARRPLVRDQVTQMRSKDLRQYLVAKKVCVKGCVEKDDLVTLLMLFANGNDGRSNAESSTRVNSGYTSTGPTSRSPPSPVHSPAHSPPHLDSSQEDVRVESPVETVPEVSTEDRTRNDEAAKNVDIQEVTGSDVSPGEGPEPLVTEAEEPADETTSTLQRPEMFTEIPVWPGLVSLSDINELSELEYLSVKQLKTLLSMNRVDYKGCIERSELLDRASRLWEEHRQSRTDVDKLDQEDICKICWDAPIECVILECGHMACCINCGKQMSECPICKQYVVRVVRFFKA